MQFNFRSFSNPSLVGFVRLRTMSLSTTYVVPTVTHLGGHHYQGTIDLVAAGAPLNSTYYLEIAKTSNGQVLQTSAVRVTTNSAPGAFRESIDEFEASNEQASTLAEVKKIPRAASEVTAGGAVSRNLVVGQNNGQSINERINGNAT